MSCRLNQRLPTATAVKGLLLAATMAVWSWPAVTCAQVKTFRVRGQVVELTTAPDLLFVLPAAGSKAADIAAEVWRAQRELAGAAATNAKAITEAREVPYLKGLLVPRLPGVKDVDLPQLADRAPQIRSAEPVYRSGGQLAIPAGTLTVRFRFPGDPPARLLFALTQEFDLQEAGRPKSATGLVRFRPQQRGADLFSVAEKLSQSPHVTWAEPDLVVDYQQLPVVADAAAISDAAFLPRINEAPTGSQPDDPLFDRQWHLTNHEYGIHVVAAWSLAPAAPKTRPIVVAVVDTGMDLKHPDLRDNLLPGRDCLDDDEDPNSKQNAHATNCAGLVAAVANNGLGVSGIAWNCRIIPVRAMTDGGPGPWSAAAEGIAWAARGGARIINCSIGGTFPSNEILDAIDDATAAGCLVIAAAGNNGGAVAFPAAYERCLAVGAIRSDNQKCDYSSWGEAVDLVAPGGLGGDNCPGIWSTDVTGPLGRNAGATGESRTPPDEPTGDYCARLAGTSFAAPIVAGVAALVWSNYPHLSAAQVRDILLGSATKIDPRSNLWRDGHHVHYGFGKVDARAAMLRAAEVAGR